MDNIYRTLKNFGLNEKELAIYLSCLTKEGLSLQSIAQNCDIKRPSAYNYVDSLVEKGILSRHKKGNHTLIYAHSPEILKSILQKKKTEIDQLESDLPQIISTLSNLMMKQKGIHKDQSILDSIQVASENNPHRPEFPAENPKFPATPTIKINIPGFTNIWLKDESHNPTGTHKDRMAWEMVVTYKNFLRSKIKGKIKKLPQMTIITSGNAGFAIQNQLKKYNLPPLKCLLDTETDEEIIKNLSSIGCEIYQVDLSKKELGWREILQLTNNTDGIDITCAEGLGAAIRFYDWLSYEILNHSPEYCFLPFGTGNLYENLLNINTREVGSENHDPRFGGEVDILKECHFIGATVNNHKSKAINLYSPHLPFSNFDEQWITIFRNSGYCGMLSNVNIIREEYLDNAIVLAKELGINAEPSGLGGLAMFLQTKKDIPKDAKVIIVNTGKAKYELAKR